MFIKKLRKKLRFYWNCLKNINKKSSKNEGRVGNVFLNIHLEMFDKHNIHKTITKHVLTMFCKMFALKMLNNVQ